MMEIHHGGKFVNHPMLYYKGGKVDYMYNIDPDRMSHEELKGIMSVDYGYNDVTKIYYNIMGRSFVRGLRLVVNDTSILQMLAEVSDNGGIELYTEHGVVSEGDGECEGEGESECGSENGSEGESDSESSVASLDNVSDNEELIEARKKKVAMRTCGKSVNSESEHGDHTEAEQMHVHEQAEDMHVHEQAEQVN